MRTHLPVLRGRLVALLATGSIALTACAGDDGYDPPAQKADRSTSSPSGSSSQASSSAASFSSQAQP